MSGHDSPCLGCGKETHHRSGKCMRCRNVGNDKSVLPNRDSDSSNYIGRGRRRHDLDNLPEMTLNEAVSRLTDTVRAHMANKRNKFAITDRRAIERLLKEVKNDSSVQHAQ